MELELELELEVEVELELELELTVHPHKGQGPPLCSHGSMQDVWNTWPQVCAALTTPPPPCKNSKQTRHIWQLLMESELVVEVGLTVLPHTGQKPWLWSHGSMQRCMEHVAACLHRQDVGTLM